MVVGHSYGGPLVIRLAAEHPKRIAGLVGLGIGYPKSVPRYCASLQPHCPAWCLLLKACHSHQDQQSLYHCRVAIAGLLQIEHVHLSMTA